MSDLRPISIEGYETPTVPLARGGVPMQMWLPIASLVVDGKYQRSIDARGKATIRKIVSEFDWACFSPVVVAAIEGGVYAIIDGQHRTTAAAVIGCEQVPCLVVIADRQAQAKAFKALNGTVTKVHPLALFRAAVAAGDEKAVTVTRLAEAQGIRILAYPVSAVRQGARECMVPGTLIAMLDRRGEGMLRDTLRLAAILARDRPGLLTRPVFDGLERYISVSLRSIDELTAAAPRVDVNRELGRAEDGLKEGQTLGEALYQRLIVAFDRAMQVAS